MKAHKLPELRQYFACVRAGDHKKVGKILKDKIVDVDSEDPDDPLGPTAVIIASELGDVEMVRVLMRAKPKSVNVNAETLTGRRAVWWAAKHGNKTLAEQLLKDSKCEVNYIDRETGCSPLFRAIISNTADVVRLLLHAGCDVNLRRLGFGQGAETPLINSRFLCRSVQMDNLEICQMLVNSLCDKNAKTEDGLTALHLAVAYRRYGICRYLLSERIKIHARSHSGITAMVIAIEHHNAAMVRILLQYGYRLDRPYRWGEMPIQQAIALHSQVCAMTLAYWGCSLTMSGKRGSFSAFYLAVGERLMTLASLLIDLHPAFLREKWLWQRDWPLSLYTRPMVRQWLSGQASTPRTLKKLCRAAIFRRLGLCAPKKVDKLPISPALKNYLYFPEHIKEEFYVEKPLSDEDCPFDCAVLCPGRRCPVIDISFSDDSDQDIEYW